MIKIFGLKANFYALNDFFRIITQHRQLTIHMAKRDIGERYAGSVLGRFWTLGHPLIQIGVYLFIFSMVFKVKLSGLAGFPTDYSVYLLSGLIPWMSLQESMTKSTTTIVRNSSLVKQVVFPLEILPFKEVLTSLLTQMITLSMLIIYILIKYRYLHLTFLLIPLLIACQILLMTGLSYLLAAVGVYFRDLKDVVQVFAAIGMYIMPIFYLPAWVPKIFKPFIFMNPFSYLVWCYQDAIYFGTFRHPWAWPVFFTISVFVFFAGYRTFKKAKTYFGNSL